ncbi:MAG TPA: methyltransferase domain-containing protein [Rhizomicrobium sp.]|nr:methyltransferase domain-containing protein [Rhizomicrobium sp.]
MSNGIPKLFDRRILALRRARALRLGGDRFLVREALEGLSERLSAVNRRFSDALAIEMPFEFLGEEQDPAAHWDLATLDANEALPLENGRFDLAISLLAFHAVNDLPGVLVQIREKLAPDGLFLAALFGGDTLFELRDSFAVAEAETTGGISPRVAPFADVRDLGGLLQRAGFALPVADVERTTVLYRSFADLVRDLRLHGETNALIERSRKPLSRETLAAMLSHYQSHHAEADGRLRATFDIVYLTGWAPHQSQQKPLRPGSAKARLADALGTSEHKVRRD